MVIQILAAIAVTERERILALRDDGRIAALASDVKFGRKSHSRTPTALTLIILGEALSSVIEKTGSFQATCFLLKRKIKNDAKNAPLSQ